MMESTFNPQVSVIIPNYNREALIGQAIQSVIDQTYTHWELIIVDDGSTDNSPTLINAYVQKDHRIKFYSRDRGPKGAPTCRNIGLQKAAGDFIIFLDSDDAIAPFCLTQRVKHFGENPHMDFLVFPILMFDQKLHDLNVLWNISTAEDDVLRFLRLDTLWQTTGPMYRREALLRVNGFREDLPFWQDFDLHLRCLLSGLSYLKFLDATPDVYHRRNFVDSISRTISFVADKSILRKRTDYYFSLIEFMRENKALHEVHMHTLWSVLFFFTSSFAVRHRDIRLFFNGLLQAKRKLNIGWTRFFVSLGYGILRMITKRVSVIKKLDDLYYGLLKKYLPDYKILSRSNTGKIKWSGPIVPASEVKTENQNFK